MGNWSELDTQITVNLDTTEIDDAINAATNDDILSAILPRLVEFKEAVTDGAQQGAREVANKTRSFQEQSLADLKVHPYASGRLGSSIEAEPNGELSFIVGTRIQHFYPLCVEFGRGPIVAKPGKMLAFYSLSGELVFRKRVGKAEPRPFVAPSYDKTDKIAKELVLQEIGHKLQGW